MKESISYLQSKLRHITKDHESNVNEQLRAGMSDSVDSLQSGKCKVCEQIEVNDYDFVLLQRDRFCEEM